MIERAEKQTILARHARRLLHLLDDTPVVPGDPRLAYKREIEARGIIEDAEHDIRTWEKTVEPIPTAAGNGDPTAIHILRSSKNPRDSLVTANEEQETDGTSEGEEIQQGEARASGALGPQHMPA